jgi:hypothetical protein
MDTSSLATAYDIRDGLLCVITLFGLIGGILLLVRRKILPGILALVGFLLLGVYPASSILIWNVLAKGSNPNYDTLDWAYYCAQSAALVIGFLAIIGALLASAFGRERRKDDGLVQAPTPQDIYTPPI